MEEYMGTQFWWFYDVLILTIAACLLYNAVERGFNKLVFRLAGFLLAFVIGFFASSPLAEFAYRAVFKENITVQIQTKLEETDFFEAMTSGLRQKFPDSEYAKIDKATLLSTLQSGEINNMYEEAAAGVLQSLLINVVTPFPQEKMQDYFAGDQSTFRQFLIFMQEGNFSEAAGILENGYFASFYQKLISMVVFLLLEAVVLIIAGIISAMAGDVEQFMHVSRFDRILGLLVGIIEIACVLISLVVAVRLVIAATDNMMMLFNEQTIAETKIFRLLYQWVPTELH